MLLGRLAGAVRHDPFDFANQVSQFLRFRLGQPAVVALAQERVQALRLGGGEAAQLPPWRLEHDPFRHRQIKDLTHGTRDPQVQAPERAPVVAEACREPLARERRQEPFWSDGR